MGLSYQERCCVKKSIIFDKNCSDVSSVVLGRPGSGCTTLLKTLANRCDEYHSIEGKVCYDSFTAEDMRRHYQGDLQYCPEEDIHFPTLGVEDTLRFAVKSRAPHDLPQDLSRKSYVDVFTDGLLSVFGLTHTKKTPVGDASIRGASGGEKKRVSITETLATRGLVTSWDKYVVLLLYLQRVLIWILPALLVVWILQRPSSS